MSRKSERAAKRAAKKAEQTVVEEEEAPEAVPIDSDSIVVDELEEKEEDLQEDDLEEDDLEEDDLEEEKAAKQARAVRPKINDEAAMLRITEEFKLKNLPWVETMTITSKEPIAIEDSTNDMARELAFYQQALEAAKMGRELIKKAGAEFTRPDDYFAEMVKSDEHMAKIQQKLKDQEASIKSSEDAKRQRHLKKFGKKVQVEKQLERQKQKADTLEKIKLLKRSCNVLLVIMNGFFSTFVLWFSVFGVLCKQATRLGGPVNDVL
ncbi:eukaryotic rRNA processing protein EBP2-domain-containing protein [Sporodiniella umbellata]|nr:eukaryotic rRNA processing protein EBP2-domain-containing protein [Sporodiniella umbellata]